MRSEISYPSYAKLLSDEILSLAGYDTRGIL